MSGCLRDAGRGLAGAICLNIVNFTGRIAVDLLERTEWASVTFTGARHRLRLVLDGDGAVGAAADFLAAMNDLDLPVPGHIVADLALLAEERRDGGAYACLDLEALTIEDR